MEADIQGNHVIPVVWNRRLYLFWPVFSTKQEDKPLTMPAAGGTVTPGAKKLQIQIAWTEFKNGKWSPKKLTAPFISKEKHPESSLSEDYKLFSFKTRTQFAPDGQRQLLMDCYGPREVVSTAQTPTGSAIEKHLFTLSVPSTRTVNATVNGVAMQPAEAKKLQIMVRDALGNPVGSPIPFGDYGTVVVRNSTTLQRKYSLYSTAYAAQDIQWTGEELVCEIPGTSTNVVGSNGNSPERLLAGTETLGLTSLVGTETVAAPMLTAIEGRPVCTITPATICNIDLAAVQTADGKSTVTTTSADPMQPVATFYFDDGQQSLTALINSTANTTIEPIVGTRFENMMMVEYDNPGGGLGQSKMLQTTPGTFRLLGMHQSYLAKAMATPVFFQDDQRTYYVVGVNGTVKARFNPHYHANVSRFARSLNRFGIDGLLTLAESTFDR